MKNSIIISAIALSLILGGCSETKTAQQLMSSGNDFVQVRDFSSAVIEFKNAVRLEPRNPNARYMLANAYLAQGSYLNAEKELSRALELGIDFANSAAQMARIKTRLDKADEVYQLVERSNDLTDDNYIRVLTYAGISALRQNKPAQGQDYLTQAIAINKDAAYSQIARAYIHYYERNFSQGLVVINKLLTEQEDVSEALLIQASLYYALQEFEHASDTYSLYLTYHPQDHGIRFLEVNSLIKAEKFEHANVLTDALLTFFKNSPLALQYKAQLEYQNKNYSEARDYAEEALIYGGDLVVAKMVAGVSSYFLGDFEQAYTRLHSIENLLLRTHPARKVLAVTKFKLGYYLAAGENFANLEGLTAEDVDLLQTSTASLISVGEFDSALAVIKKAEILSPDNAELIAQKGLIQIAQNDINGIKSLEHAIKLDSSLADAQLTLAIEYLKTEQVEKAKNVASKLQGIPGEEYLGHLLQGIIFVKEKKEILAIDSFQQSLLLKPDNVASLYNLALLYQSSNETNAAFVHLKKVITLSPEHQGALEALVSLGATANIKQDVIDFLVAEQNSDNFNLSYALAKILSINQEFSKAIVILDSIVSSADINAIYWMALGDNHLALNDITKASSSFAEGLKIDAKHYVLSLRYIGTLDRLSEFEQALSQVRQAYAYHEEDARLEVLLAYFYMRNNELILAKSMLKKVTAKQIEHHLVDSVEGEIALIEKRYPEAINALSRLYQTKATDINAVSLARSLKFNNQQNEAENLLEKHIKNNPTSVKVRLLLAQLYTDDNRHKKIIQYLALVEALPDNIMFLNNLAWNQYKLGQSAQALKHIERAFELEPKAREIQETYGHVLIANKKLTHGVNLLKQAISSGSNGEETTLLLTETLRLIKESKG